MPIETQETFRTPNRWDQKRTCPRHTVLKTPNTQKRDTVIESSKGATSSHI